MANMIELDELLNGTPTWEQVVEFWKDDGEFCDEEYLVEAIERWLLTEDQRKKLFEHRLSVEKILNGRYYGAGKEGAFVRSLYDDWNTKLGFNLFGG